MSATRVSCGSFFFAATGKTHLRQKDTDDRRSGPPLGQREYNLKDLNETRDDGEHSSIPLSTGGVRGVRGRHPVRL